MAHDLLHILMLGVDDVCQIHAIDLLLVDPHLDLLLEMVEVLHIAANDLCDSRTPTTGAKKKIRREK